MNWKSFLGKLVLILVVLVAIFFIIRYFWADSRIAEMQEKISQTLAQVDSLQKENESLLSQVTELDSLVTVKTKQIYDALKYKYAPSIRLKSVFPEL